MEEKKTAKTTGRDRKNINTTSFDKTLKGRIHNSQVLSAESVGAC